MKSKKIFLLLFLFLTILGCKDNLKTNDSTIGQLEDVVAQDVFKVTINMVVKKDDDLCLLFSEDGTPNFKDGVWKRVTGLENEQVVQFDMPSDKFPTLFRLDLGKNKDQEDIKINSIKFEYKAKTREIKGEEIGVFFRPDDSKCFFNSSSGIIKAIVKDGKRETPSLYPHEAIQKVELQKLAN